MDGRQDGPQSGGSLILTNIGELATPLGRSARTGAQMRRLLRIKNAGVVIDKGIISFCGEMTDTDFRHGLAEAKAAGTPVLDAQGMACVPGFIDCHTHFIFAGTREDEFFWRANGLPYMEIHRRGGGILRTVEATRQASQHELFELGSRRLASMLSQGITTVESKSGYGLDLDTELRILETAKTLRAITPIDIVSTYLGPHAVPPEFLRDPDGYLDFVIDTVLPAIRSKNLAQFADIFCEDGVFDLEQSRRYLLAARELGFHLKLHADEIAPFGGAGLAADLRATSADHLLKAADTDLLAMARSGTIAVCLPLTAFTLREPYARARFMIDNGLAVALASDFNPGSCYSQSVPLLFALAVLYMSLTIDEALTGLTLNAAAALGLAQSTGSIEAGKKADMLLLDAPSCDFLAYNVATNLVKTVLKAGTVVYTRT
ncbi:MAG TPA: imidazolonepropionase [Spirochaetales bacterium]|nr:imidazolonepropionase [Spirochaetales bacterium]